MGHFFKTQPNPKFLHPTQPNPWMDPTHEQLCSLHEYYYSAISLTSSAKCKQAIDEFVTNYENRLIEQGNVGLWR